MNDLPVIRFIRSFIVEDIHWNPIICTDVQLCLHFIFIAIVVFVLGIVFQILFQWMSLMDISIVMRIKYLIINQKW